VTPRIKPRDFLGAFVVKLGLAIASREYREQYEDLLRRGYRARALARVRDLLREK
jgi:hypothetical protein